MKPKTAQEYELEIEWLKKRNDVLEERTKDQAGRYAFLEAIHTGLVEACKKVEPWAASQACHDPSNAAQSCFRACQDMRPIIYR